MPKLIAAVEGGGTTFKVALCDASSGEILHKRSVDAEDPATTLTRCALFLQEHAADIVALGIATFGPVGIHPSNTQTYGRVLASSPKRTWRGVDVVTPLREACGNNIPVLLDTDVNAPAAAEYVQARQDNNTISSCAYITVGTGVGVGLVVNHKTVHGILHPEGGHVPVPQLPADSFGGYSWGTNASLPYSGVNTVEALASSVALMERYQQQTAMGGTNDAMDRSGLKDVSDESEIWDHAANALASLCTTLLLTLSIERIVLGGGVMSRPSMLGKIQKRTSELLNDYIALDTTGGEGNEAALKSIIRLSKHGDDAGLVGAIELARRALNTSGAAGGVDTTTSVKQKAFQTGVVNGLLVGIVGTALFAKYMLQKRR